MQFSTIRALYPTFENIFEKHIQNAKFDSVPSKGRDFRHLKLSLISLWHLEREHKSVRRPGETRSALIQALVVEHDFQQAFQLIPFQLIRNTTNAITGWFWYNPRGGESFEHDMKKKASQVSDSQFLQQLESHNEEDLRSAAQKAKVLAQTELSSSIATVVKTLTQNVLQMQKDICGRQVQLQSERDEREVLKNALVEFIGEINRNSARGEFS